MGLGSKGWKSLSVLLILVTLLSFGYAVHPSESNYSVSASFESQDIQLNEWALSQTNTISPSWNHTTPDETWIRPVAISKDGTTLVEGSVDMVTLLDPLSGDVVWDYNTSSIVMDVAVSNNGSRIVAGTFDNRTILFDKESNQPIWISKCDHYIPAVDVSGDGDTIVSGDWIGRVYVFDSSDNETLYEYDTGDRITDVAVSINGSRIVAGGLHDTVFTFSRDSTMPLWSYDTKGEVQSVAVSENGTEIAGGSSEGVFVFGPSTNDTIWEYHATGFQSIDVSDDGSTISAGRSNVNDVNLFYWSIMSNDTLWTFNNTNQIRAVTLSEDGRFLAASSYDNHTYLFGKSSNATLFTYESEGTMASSDMSADGTRVISSCSQGITHFFMITPPEQPSIIASRTYYNATESINVTVNAKRGSFQFAYCNISIIHNEASMLPVTLSNTTSLDSELVSFYGTIGPFVEGNLSISASVYDAGGYTNISTPAEKIIDGTAPLVEVLDFSPPEPSSESTVSVKVNASDGLSGLDSVVLYYSIDDTSTWTQLSHSMIDGSIYNFTIPNMINDSHVQFYVEATDQVGNIAVDDNEDEFYEYLVVDPTESTTSTTPTTDTTSNTQPVDPMGPVILLAATAGVGIVLVSGGFYYRSRMKGEPAEPPEVTAKSVDSHGETSPDSSLNLEETSDEE